MLTQFLIFLRSPLLKSDCSSLFVHFTFSFFSGSQCHWTEAQLGLGQNTLSSIPDLLPAQVCITMDGKLQQREGSVPALYCPKHHSQPDGDTAIRYHQSHTRDTSPAHFEYFAGGGAYELEETAAQYTSVSSRIAILPLTACVFTDALPGTDSSRIESLVWKSIPMFFNPLCPA